MFKKKKKNDAHVQSLGVKGLLLSFFCLIKIELLVVPTSYCQESRCKKLCAFSTATLEEHGDDAHSDAHDDAHGDVVNEQYVECFLGIRAIRPARGSHVLFSIFL